MIGSLLLAPALMLQVTTTAPPTQQPPRQVQTTSRDDPDRMICKRPKPELGSRVATRRVCMTQAQWRAHQQGMSALRRDIQNGADPMVVE